MKTDKRKMFSPEHLDDASAGSRIDSSSVKGRPRRPRRKAMSKKGSKRGFMKVSATVQHSGTANQAWLETPTHRVRDSASQSSITLPPGMDFVRCMEEVMKIAEDDKNRTHTWSRHRRETDLTCSDDNSDAEEQSQISYMSSNKRVHQRTGGLNDSELFTKFMLVSPDLSPIRGSGVNQRKREEGLIQGISPMESSSGQNSHLGTGAPVFIPPWLSPIKSGPL